MAYLLNIWFSRVFRLSFVFIFSAFALLSPAFSQDDQSGNEEKGAEDDSPASRMPTLPTMPGAAKVNLLSNNYNGEQTKLVPDYWDGVDNQNYLCVNVQSVSIIQDAGRFVRTAFPPSPAFVDMNNDGLNDLMVADSYGFLWLYLNSGEPGAPKFTTGKFFHTFLGHGVKIHVCDYNQNGRFDVLASGLHGDIAIVENLGTPQDPKFTRRMGVPRYVDPESGGDRKDAFERVFLGKNPMVLGISWRRGLRIGTATAGLI